MKTLETTHPYTHRPVGREQARCQWPAHLSFDGFDCGASLAVVSKLLDHLKPEYERAPGSLPRPAMRCRVLIPNLRVADSLVFARDKAADINRTCGSVISFADWSKVSAFSRWA